MQRRTLVVKTFASRNFYEWKKMQDFYVLLTLTFYELTKKEIFGCINIRESIKYEILTEINFRKL